MKVTIYGKLTKFRRLYKTVMNYHQAQWRNGKGKRQKVQYRSAIKTKRSTKRKPVHQNTFND